MPLYSVSLEFFQVTQIQYNTVYGVFSYFFVMIKKLNRDISHDNFFGEFVSEDMTHDSEDMTLF